MEKIFIRKATGIEDNSTGEIPILKNPCGNSTSFLEGLKAAREGNQHRRVAQWHTWPCSRGIRAHNLSWALHPLSLSSHNLKCSDQSCRGGSSRKMFSSFCFCCCKCEESVPMSYTGCPGCRVKSFCVQQVVWFQHNTAEQNSAGEVLCILFSPWEQPGNLGHFCTAPPSY